MRSTVVRKATSLLRPLGDAPGLLSLGQVRGRVTEISCGRPGGALSALVELLLEAQQKGEVIAWVEAGPTIFFPPDFDFVGIDLAALLVVRVKPDAALLSTDWLVRSGAFGLVVVDGAPTSVDEAALGRLARLAEDNDTALVFLSRKDNESPSLGSLVSLRIAVERMPDRGVAAAVLRDRRFNSRAVVRRSLDGPACLF